MKALTKNTFLAKQDGFSLMELMIVVAIIGILSTIAFPRFQAFQARARQAEAKSNLGQIATLQEVFFMENNAYSVLAPYGANTANTTANACSSNALSFTIKGCNTSAASSAVIRYNYSSTGGTTFITTAQTGTAAANRLAPGCATSDAWTINENNIMANTSNGITSCF